MNQTIAKIDILLWMPNEVEQVTDEILVLDAQNGDHNAFETLVSRWHKRLCRQAFHLTGRTEAAWDVAQESWLDIARGLRGLHDSASFGHWAYRIVSHKAYNWRRRSEIERPSAVETEGGATTNDTVLDVHAVLHGLPAGARMVLNLYYLEGFTVAEISRILGVPEGTVKSRLHAARIQFKTYWESLTRPRIRQE